MKTTKFRGYSRTIIHTDRDCMQAIVPKQPRWEFRWLTRQIDQRPSCNDATLLDRKHIGDQSVSIVSRINTYQMDDRAITSNTGVLFGGNGSDLSHFGGFNVDLQQFDFPTTLGNENALSISSHPPILIALCTLMHVSYASSCRRPDEFHSLQWHCLKAKKLRRAYPWRTRFLGTDKSRYNQSERNQDEKNASHCHLIEPIVRTLDAIRHLRSPQLYSVTHRSR